MHAPVPRKGRFLFCVLFFAPLFGTWSLSLLLPAWGEGLGSRCVVVGPSGENAKFAEFILWRNLANLGLNVNGQCRIRDALSLAANGGCMKFHGHSACLGAVSTAWHGAILPETPVWVIAINLLFPFLLLQDSYLNCGFRPVSDVMNLRALRNHGNRKLSTAPNLTSRHSSIKRSRAPDESLSEAVAKAQDAANNQVWTRRQLFIEFYTAPVSK